MTNFLKTNWFESSKNVFNITTKIAHITKVLTFFSTSTLGVNQDFFLFHAKMKRSGKFYQKYVEMVKVLQF
jgi:hypothetical protein